MQFTDTDHQNQKHV